VPDPDEPDEEEEENLPKPGQPADDPSGATGAPMSLTETSLRKPPVRTTAAKVVAMYPSLAAPPREHLISFSARIPLSMIDELTETCLKRKVDKSALVRDFIAAGLSSLRAVPTDRHG
jgi:hypothetical protein